jgi:serine/threonine-protein kinase
MDVSVADPLVGQLLDGRYAVRSRIAKGGMATVYLALDERLDREVALKVMSPALVDDEDFVRRFTREARSAARLNHHGIVQVFDQGTDGDVVFLAMEYVPGQTLRDLMRERGPMSAGEALDVLEPVLEALAAAHRAGIVHRDVKPENVLIADDGRVKVADFGLARAVDAGTAHSQTGLLLGTVSYLAPEQVERGVADARSDVYAAGVVLFELLTGSKPFAGDTAVQVALQHVSSRVPAPSTRVEHLDPALDELVLLAAARNPDDRPADARELLMVVRETRRRLPQEELDATPEPLEPLERTSPPIVVALPPEPDDDPNSRTMALEPASAQRHQSPTAGPRRRHRGRTAVVVVLVLAVLLGLGGWYLGAGPGAYAQVPKVVGSTQAEAQASLARHDLSSRVTQGYSESVPVGSVVSADPAEGERVRKNGTVTLVVSRGPERHDVPQLATLSEDAARSALTNASLAVGKVTRQFDTNVPEGTVISASKKPGTQLRAGTAVDLVVSKGPEPVALSSWVGKPAADATSAMTSAGLKVKASQEFNDTVAKGLVISQKPSAGTVYKGQTVSLVVSKGPELVPVPRVVGKSREDARRTLQRAGFAVRETSVFGGNGRVIAQSPGVGTKAKRGSTVTIALL